MSKKLFILLQVLFICVSRGTPYNGSYSFSVKYKDSHESFNETETSRNDVLGEAYPIQLGKNYIGQIGCNDHWDFYKFTISSPASLPLKIQSKIHQFWVTCFDSNANELNSFVVRENSVTGEINDTYKLDFSQAGTYYVRMALYDVDWTGVYTFSLGDIAPATYTVTFSGNGGSVSTGSKTVNAGTAITLPSASRNGYKLLGWSENSNATYPTYYEGASFTVDKDVTFYAVWQKVTPDDPSTTPTIMIHNFQSERTEHYKTSIRFTTLITNAPLNTEVHWFVNGSDVGTGEKYTVLNPTADYTIQVKLLDVSGRVVAESDTETVFIRQDLWSRILAFLLIIFGGNRPKDQSVVYGMQ